MDDIVTYTDEESNSDRYEKMANWRLRNSDTVVLGGYGCFVKVRNGGLVVEYETGHGLGNARVLSFNRGIHKVKKIVILAGSGYISFGAIEWACQQDITIYMLNYDGEFLQVLTPKQTRNARLCYLQYKASESDLGIRIARELITRKTASQLDLPFLMPDIIKRYAESSTWELVKEIAAIRALEGQLAHLYWNTFIGCPIRWDMKSARIVPPHWLSITERLSPLSQSGKHAINPFHAALNFAYALLEAECLRAIYVADLEPSIAFLHASSEQHHSLVFDLMEPFRPVVDDMVLAFFRKNIFSKDDFYQEMTGEVRMNDGLRKYLLTSCRVSAIEVDRLARWVRNTLEGTAT